MNIDMTKEDIERIRFLTQISMNSAVEDEDRQNCSRLMQAIHQCAITAKVVAQFNMWRGDPHFDEADINAWLDRNRKEADEAIDHYIGPKMKVKFMYHSQMVLELTIRAIDKPDAICKAMGEFKVIIAPQDMHFDTIVVFPTSA